MKLIDLHTPRTSYITREGAKQAARRMFKKGANTVNVDGEDIEWTMDNVVVKHVRGVLFSGWVCYVSFPENAEPEPVPELQMSDSCRQALADMFYRQQAGRAELERRRAERAGLAGSGFRPRY